MAEVVTEKVSGDAAVPASAASGSNSNAEVSPPIVESTGSASSGEPQEMLKVKLAFKKDIHDLELPIDSTIGEFRSAIEKLTQVPPPLQKFMFKGMQPGLMKENEITLRAAKIPANTKIMMVGSTIDAVLAATPPPAAVAASAAMSFETTKVVEPLCEQEKHKKILAKGVPDEAEKGDTTKHMSLPPTIKGLYNNHGTKVRLTVKVFSEELWIASATSTEQIGFSSITAVNSEPINGSEGYAIMSFQLGKESSKCYFLYFVPAQYVRAIRASVQGYP